MEPFPNEELLEVVVKLREIILKLQAEMSDRSNISEHDGWHRTAPIFELPRDIHSKMHNLMDETRKYEIYFKEGK